MVVLSMVSENHNLFNEIYLVSDHTLRVSEFCDLPAVSAASVRHLSRHDSPLESGRLR